jgi:hypothetical protein
LEGGLAAGAGDDHAGGIRECIGRRQQHRRANKGSFAASHYGIFLIMLMAAAFAI